MQQKQLPFFLIVTSLFIAITSPSLWSDGMFADGLMYAAISKNLAHGYGSFWFLKLSNTFDNAFHGHPPLALGLQSIFFKVFGDGIYTERLYSILTFVFTGLGIYYIWKEISPKIYHSLFWIPLLFWITIPLNIWCAANNMLENTMMVFTTFSIFFLLKSIKTTPNLYLILGATMLFLGFLTKGFVALFPLSFFFWYFLFHKEFTFKQFLVKTILLVVALIALILLLFLIIPDSLTSLSIYFEKQIVGSLNTTKTTVDYRFFIVKRLLEESIIPILFVLLSFIVSKKIKINLSPSKKWFFTFLLLSLSGVIPIMISMKQSSFYMLAALPVLSISLSILAAPTIYYFIEKIDVKTNYFRIIRLFSYLSLAIAVFFAFNQIGNVGRNKEQLSDVHAIIASIPNDEIINISQDLEYNWLLFGYFSRHSFISLESIEDTKRTYFLKTKEQKNMNVEGYEQVKLDLILYNLYKKNKQ